MQAEVKRSVTWLSSTLPSWVCMSTRLLRFSSFLHYQCWIPELFSLLMIQSNSNTIRESYIYFTSSGIYRYKLKCRYSLNIYHMSHDGFQPISRAARCWTHNNIKFWKYDKEANFCRASHYGPYGPWGLKTIFYLEILGPKVVLLCKFLLYLYWAVQAPIRAQAEASASQASWMIRPWKFVIFKRQVDQKMRQIIAMI